MKTYQLNNGRWQVTPQNPDHFKNLPKNMVAKILWRSFATQQEAQAFAASIA